MSLSTHCHPSGAQPEDSSCTRGKPDSSCGNNGASSLADLASPTIHTSLASHTDTAMHGLLSGAAVAGQAGRIRTQRRAQQRQGRIRPGKPHKLAEPHEQRERPANTREWQERPEAAGRGSRLLCGPVGGSPYVCAVAAPALYTACVCARLFSRCFAARLAPQERDSLAAKQHACWTVSTGQTARSRQDSALLLVDHAHPLTLAERLHSTDLAGAQWQQGHRQALD